MTIKNCLLQSLLIGFFVFISSCNDSVKVEKNCGIEMDAKEVDALNALKTESANPYEFKNGNAVFVEISDSLYKQLPDSLDAEVFLLELTANEVCIEVYLPPGKTYIETLSCYFMNAKFKNKLPEQRIISFYSYALGELEDDVFEKALKLKE